MGSLLRLQIIANESSRLEVVTSEVVAPYDFGGLGRGANDDRRSGWMFPLSAQGTQAAVPGQRPLFRPAGFLQTTNPVKGFNFWLFFHCLGRRMR